MTGAIILAAGSSSRMGQSKQLLDIKGERLLLRTIRVVLQSKVSRSVVVLGAEHESHQALIRHMAVDTVYNPDWPRGIGSSIRTGLNHLLSNYPDTGVVIIFVCDQPLLSAGTINTLVGQHAQTNKPIVASTYSGGPGVPALFEKRYFKELRSLPDEQGAKNIILQNSSDVALVDFPGGRIDLDTTEDYNSFMKGWDDRNASA